MFFLIGRMKFWGKNVGNSFEIWLSGSFKCFLHLKLNVKMLKGVGFLCVWVLGILKFLKSWLSPFKAYSYRCLKAFRWKKFQRCLNMMFMSRLKLLRWRPHRLHELINTLPTTCHSTWCQPLLKTSLRKWWSNSQRIGWHC